VLILPPGHERDRTRRGVSAREHRLVVSVAAVPLALIVAVVVSLAAGGAGSGQGCVHAPFPGPVGAEHVDSCGQPARALCAELGTRGSGYAGEAARTIAVECRKAGLRVGP